MPPKKLTNREIEALYDSGDFRVSQERNDFLLPQIVDFVRKNNWINTRPEYQRRLVWDRRKRSRLIESLLMNVPVPPIFLFEHDLNRYEVMDGQQRTNAIIEYYENRLTLSGLEHWPSLNDRKYSDLPPRIQRGLDRRRISATVLLAETGGSPEAASKLRRLVFERLNTGGQSLNAQELRNCLHAGPLNDLLVILAGTRLFNEMWQIPPYEDNIRGEHIASVLAENRYYKRMVDVEIVLRFFAFREPPSKIRGAVKTILDRYMEEHAKLDPSKVTELRDVFLSRLQLVFDIFGINAFKLGNEDGGADRLSPPLYDALMVSVDRLFEKRAALISRKGKLVAALQDAMANEAFYALIVGRANTAETLRLRIDKVERLLLSAAKK